MAYTSSAIDARDMAFTAAGATTTPTAKALPKRGLFSRMLDAMMAARMRQAERDVARYLAETGGKVHRRSRARDRASLPVDAVTLVTRNS